jgi:hypothetical protein
MTCRSWDPLPRKADAVGSTLRVPVKDLNSQIISYAPIKPIQPFRSFTRHFILYLLIDYTLARIAWKSRDCACVLKQNKDKTNTSSRCVPNIRTSAASMKCVKRGIDPHPTALQNHSPRVRHSSLTSVWSRSHDFRRLWWAIDQATEAGRKILNKPNFILCNESFVFVYNLYQASLRFSTSENSCTTRTGELPPPWIMIPWYLWDFLRR